MFENLGQRIANFGNTVATSASNMMDNTKRSFNNFSESMALKNKIDNARKDIYNIYTAIGERYFVENRSNVPEGYGDFFAKIEEDERIIAQAEEELKTLSDVKTCPNCGASVKKEFDFCTVCGQRVKVEQAQQAQQAQGGNQIECPSCHKINGSDALFCTGCGSKLEKPAEPESIAQKTCPNCGNEILVDAAFCNICGISLN